MAAPVSTETSLSREGAAQSNGHIETDGHQTPKQERRRRSTPWNIGCGSWCRKYFWEGQALNDEQKHALEEVRSSDPLFRRVLVRYRRVIGMGLPALVYHFLWWSIMVKHNYWRFFPEKFAMSFTMIIGSMVAGMTTEGGGAVAFPVMTLALAVKPSVARDFSLMIQSSGMSAATFAIFFMRVNLEYHSIAFCSMGGMVGLLFGFYYVDPMLSPAQKKMGFVSIFFAFAFALFLLNRYHKRRTFQTIPDFKLWKGVVLVITGLVGGVCTSFAGSGLDICTFSILTILFRVSEKIATPTCVVLMALNSLLGFFWREVIMRDISAEAWEYLAVCFPVVVLGAPLGSVLGTHFHRQVLAACVYILDTVSLVSAFILVRPMSPLLGGISAAIILSGFVFYSLLAIIGKKLLTKLEMEMNLDPSKPVAGDVEVKDATQATDMDISKISHQYDSDNQATEKKNADISKNCQNNHYDNPAFEQESAVF